MQNSHSTSRHNFSPSYYIILVFFLGFTPFFSPVPLATDVQPVFFLLAAVAIAASQNFRVVSYVELLLVLLAILSLFYQYDVNDIQLFPATRFIFAAIAYGFFRRNIPILTQKAVFVIALINFFLLLFHFLSPPTFISIFGHFVRIIKIEVIGARGASGLAPEPGFAGAVSVCILATSIFLKDFKNDGHFFIHIFILSFLSVALTRSGTGTLLLGGVLTLRYARLNYKSAAMLITIIAIGIYVINNIDIGRGGSAILLLIQNPRLALLADASMGARVLNFTIGLFSAISHPFGYGSGSYNAVSPQISRELGLPGMFVGKIGTLSTFSTNSVELGVVFWFFMAYLFTRSIRQCGKKAIPFLFLSFYFIGTTFSLAFPPTWFFFAATHYNWRKYEKNSTNNQIRTQHR